MLIAVGILFALVFISRLVFIFYLSGWTTGWENKWLIKLSFSAFLKPIVVFYDSSYFAIGENILYFSDTPSKNYDVFSMTIEGFSWNFYASICVEIGI